MSSLYSGVLAALGCLMFVAACDSEGETSAAASRDVEKCPTSFWSLKEEAGPYYCSLKPNCAQASGLFGSNPYLASGGICTAAIHAGLLTDAPIVLKIEFPGLTDEKIEGSEANGITTATSIPQPEKGTRLALISIAE